MYYTIHLLVNVCYLVPLIVTVCSGNQYNSSTYNKHAGMYKLIIFFLSKNMILIPHQLDRKAYNKVNMSFIVQ